MKASVKDVKDWKDRILNLANIIGAGWFAVVFCLFFFMPGSYSLFTRAMGLAASALFGAASLFLSFLYAKSEPRLLKDISRGISIKELYIVCAAVMLLLQLVIIFTANYRPITDAGYIDTISRSFVEGRDLNFGMDEEHSFYLERYSNNWGLFLVETGVYKLVYALLGRIPYATMQLVNAAFIQLSLFLLYRISLMVFNSKKQQALCILLMTLHPVIYAYSCVYYTDTLSMPFVLGALLFAIKAFNSKSSKCFCGYSVASSLCIGIGYSIKGSVLVIAVAIMIYAVFKCGTGSVCCDIKAYIKRLLVMLLSITLCFTAVNFSVETVMYSSGAVTEENVERYGFPKTHWIMMGLKDRGGYDHDSFQYTFSLESMSERDERCKEQIKTILKDYGAAGTLKHFVNKLFYTWRGGQYLSTIQYNKSPDSAVKTFFSDNKAYQMINLFIQCAMVFYMFASYLFASLKKDTGYVYLIRLTVLGLCLFLMMWETRSRYMINMLPLFYMLSADGLGSFSRFIEKRFLKSEIRRTSAA